MNKTIVTFFTENGIPKTGLSPTIKIRRVSDGHLMVNSDPMDDIGDGWYRYIFTTYHIGTDYVVVCDGTSTLTGSERYTYGSEEDTEVIRKIMMNRLELHDGTAKNWKLYDDDNTTVLLTFNVSDKNGGPIYQVTASPSKRSKAV